MSAPVRAQRCETCGCWQRVPGRAGQCRRKPPEVLVMPDAREGVTTRWPETLPGEWCCAWWGEDTVTFGGGKP